MINTILVSLHQVVQWTESHGQILLVLKALKGLKMSAKQFLVLKSVEVNWIGEDERWTFSSRAYERDSTGVRIGMKQNKIFSSDPIRLVRTLSESCLRELNVRAIFLLGVSIDKMISKNKKMYIERIIILE